MSFLFARKTEDYFYILADTKINYDGMRKNIKDKIGEDKVILLDNYGIIKNVIINKNLCLACAGTIEYFNELLEYVEENDITALEEINNKALEIHRKYKLETDFIIAYADGLIRNLFLVKNGKIEEKESCWIGVQDCFDAFQRIRFNEEFRNKNYKAESSEDYNKMSNDKKSFEKVLQLNICPDYVGKYYVDCSYTREGFHYMERMEAEIVHEQVLYPNDSINFYDTVESGGCLYITYCENNNYSIYYEQIKKKILFEPYVKANGYNHLRFPREINMY